MYQTITHADFHHAFHSMGRGDQFSYQARNKLFNYLEEYEESTGEKIELDVIALCCEWCESGVVELIRNYNINVKGLDENERKEAVENYLNEHTMCLGETNNGYFLYTAF